MSARDAFAIADLFDPLPGAQIDPLPALVVPPAEDSAHEDAELRARFREVYELTTDEKVARSKAAIDRVIEGGHPVAVAYSAGKDSTVMLYLVLEVARERREAGQALTEIIVTHATTGVDNPAYEQVARGEIERIRAYAAAHDLPVRVDIARPSMNDTWAVRIISGRALPTFANSSTRDCSITLKLQPQERQRKATLRELQAAGTPVVLVGTRFDESDGRYARMMARGETDDRPWVQEVRNNVGKLVREELRLSPICFFSQEDVWVILAELQTSKRQSFTNAEAIWEAYRDGGNSSCAVVSDDTMKANAKACGARFGCWSCAAVGRDKSLEAMIESDEKYAYLRGLNRLQRFIVDTQYDLGRRQWVGRTITEDGYIAIAPDAYSPAMQRDLLRYALTLDRREQRAAARLGLSPRFEIVSLQQLVAIDVIWSMQGHQPRPFEAFHIWCEVNERGLEFDPPAVDASSFGRKMPGPRWLYVGRDYDDDSGCGPAYTGARHLVADLVGATESGGCAGNVTLGNGRVVMDVEASDMFEVDDEGAELFLTWEILEERLHEKTAGQDSGMAFRHYQVLGTFSTSRRHLGDQDYMLRRADWKRRNGVYSMTVEQLLERSVSMADRKAGVRCPPGQKTLSEDYEERFAAESARRLATARPRPRP